MKKFKVFGLLALILAFGLILAGCGGGEELDTWTAVTSLAQLNGTWKGVKSETHTLKELWSDWDKYSESIFGNMSREHIFEAVWAINSAAKTLSETIVNTYIFSGEKIDSAWDVMKTWDYGDNPPTFNDKNHSYSWTYNSGTQSIVDGLFKDFQINQNGKKLKWPSWLKKDFFLTKQ